MGYAVQVDPDALASGAQRLAAVAETLETVAGRVLGLCGGAGGAGAGAAELSAALHEAGRETARAVGQGASVVDALEACMRLAAEDYRLLEQALTSRWSTTGDIAPAAAAGRDATGGVR